MPCNAMFRDISDRKDFDVFLICFILFFFFEASQSACTPVKRIFSLLTSKMESCYYFALILPYSLKVFGGIFVHLVFGCFLQLSIVL